MRHCIIFIQYLVTCSSADPEGGDKKSNPPPPPPKIRKSIGFLSNTGLDHLKIIKLPSQHSMLGHHRPASETAFRWRADDGPLIVAFGSSPPHQIKKQKQKTSKLDTSPPPPPDQTFWIRASMLTDWFVLCARKPPH